MKLGQRMYVSQRGLLVLTAETLMAAWDFLCELKPPDLEKQGFPVSSTAYMC